MTLWAFLSFLLASCATTGKNIPAAESQTPDESSPVKITDPKEASGKPDAHDRYHVVGEIVTDGETGLMWQRSTAPEQLNWKEAKNYCEDLVLHGHDDWRLPKKRELRSIRTRKKEKGCHLTPGVWEGDCWWFWSASPAASKNYAAWYVYMFSGLADYSDQESKHYVRCVRLGPLKIVPK